MRRFVRCPSLPGTTASAGLSGLASVFWADRLATCRTKFGLCTICAFLKWQRMRLGNFKKAQIVQDRKSTRLNSSHGYISYAVFCLKKKKKSKKEHTIPVR